MAFQSIDLQKVCLKYLKEHVFPDTFLKAALAYHPRLHRLLIKPDQKVFDSDLETLANFFQTSQFSKDFSKNRFETPFEIQQKFHKEVRNEAFQREARKFEKPPVKLSLMNAHLEKLNKIKYGGNENTTNLIDRLMKQVNIRKARKLGDRSERARAFVDTLVKSRLAKRERNPELPVQPKNQRPDLAI